MHVHIGELAAHGSHPSGIDSSACGNFALHVHVACTAVDALWPRPPRVHVPHGFFVVEHDDLSRIPFCDRLTLSRRKISACSRQVFVRTYEKYDSPTRAVVLGKLQCNRWMAASRQKLWWMVPSWGDSASQIPEETQFLLIRMSQEDASKGTTPEEETYALIIPMVSGPYRSSIRQGRTDKRNLVLTVESGDEDVDCNQDLDLCFISAGMLKPRHHRLFRGARSSRPKKLCMCVHAAAWAFFFTPRMMFTAFNKS